MMESLGENNKKRGAMTTQRLDAPPSVPWAYPLVGHSNLGRTQWDLVANLDTGDSAKVNLQLSSTLQLLHLPLFNVQLCAIYNWLKQIWRCQPPSSLHCYTWPFSPLGPPHEPASVVRHSATVALLRVHLTHEVSKRTSWMAIVSQPISKITSSSKLSWFPQGRSTQSLEHLPLSFGSPGWQKSRFPRSKAAVNSWDDMGSVSQTLGTQKQAWFSRVGPMGIQ